MFFPLRQKDFIFAYKRGPYQTQPETDDTPNPSGPSSALIEPARKRPRIGDPVTVAESTPPSPGRNRSTVTYSRFQRYHPNTENRLQYSLRFFYGINGTLL